MRKISQISIWLLILIWGGVNQLYWSFAPNIANYNNQSLHTSVLQIVHGLTLLGPTIILLVLGSYIKRRKFNIVAFSLKVWLNTFILGLVACLFIAMCGGANPQNFYDSLFPVLRGTYSLIFAIILGMLLGKVIDKLPDEYQKYIVIIIWALIFISSFSTPNMFGWSNNTAFCFML